MRFRSAAKLTHGPGFITNDPWLAKYLSSPRVRDFWRECEKKPPLITPKCPHARQLVADVEAGMTSRDAAKKYGYRNGDSARDAFRTYQRRLADDARV